VPDPQWYRPREAIASPDILVLWEREFGRLPEPIDEIIPRCRTYVMEAAPRLVVIEPYARIARIARAAHEAPNPPTEPSGESQLGAGASVGGHEKRAPCLRGGSPAQ
jgi:hypothetical protein